VHTKNQAFAGTIGERKEISRKGEAGQERAVEVNMIKVHCMNI
jgi:hypothetical protein